MELVSLTQSKAHWLHCIQFVAENILSGPLTAQT
jgi:hypothetical protein